MQIEEVKFYNPGILVNTMSDEVFEELKSSCQFQIKNKNVAHGLKRAKMFDYSVSGIKESLIATIPKSYENYLQQFANEYVSYYNLGYTKKPKVVQSWLNLQEKYEYRPLHKHFDNSGTGLSFVTYINIPYDKDTEDAYENHYRATVFRNGRIEFVYNTFTGFQTMETIDIDKSYEGKTILFLNSLIHIVYPFYTSDDYRVSLAGNIVFV